MRILLLSYLLQPDSAFVANRTLKLAKFLIRRGNDVRILTAADSVPGGGLYGVDPKRFILAPMPESSLLGTTLERFSPLRGKSVDACSGWANTALRTAKMLFETWKPETIYATCPPHSTAVIAAQMSQAHDIPFITEFRDRWAYGADSEKTPRNRQWDKDKERAVLSRATAIISTSPEWAESYQRRYRNTRIAVALDGFDPDEYPLSYSADVEPDREVLKVLCTSPFIAGQTDLRRLFQGIAALGQGKKDIRLEIVGDHGEDALAIAKEERVHKQLDLIPAESRDEIIERQYAADVLALSLSNDPRDAGRVAPELFDCIGARRPVVAVGPGRGVATEIIRKRNLGIVTNEPKVIASALARQLAKKRAVGVVPPLPETVRGNAQSSVQFRTLETILFDAVGESDASIAAE